MNGTFTVCNSGMFWDGDQPPKPARDIYGQQDGEERPIPGESDEQFGNRLTANRLRNWPEVFDNDVSFADQPLGQFLPASVIEIQCDLSLIASRDFPGQWDAIFEWPPLPHRVAQLRVFRLDYIGP